MSDCEKIFQASKDLLPCARSGRLKMSSDPPVSVSLEVTVAARVTTFSNTVRMARLGASCEIISPGICSH